MSTQPKTSELHTKLAELQKKRQQEDVRATVVGRDAVLAGDPKVFRLLCNTNLNKNIPSRGSKEERIRILLRVWANIQGNRYNK